MQHLIFDITHLQCSLHEDQYNAVSILKGMHSNTPCLDWA
uniref:Uncharacterized protein n=1 Tax=Anguilla anguilla TaxID=7936 RepID=A0A0E9SJY8_ANGAN